ncbi:TNF receptor-associated factor 3, partial [Paramuricea clavata]
MLDKKPWKIPDSVRLTITRGEEYLKWTIKELLQALLTEVELREDYRLTPQVKPTAGNGRRMYNASALQVNRSLGRDKDRCAFCMGKHRHEDCARVKDMRERTNLIRKFARCYKCLERGHCARDCKVVVQCKNCKGGHHSALCETEVSSASEEEGAQVGNEASTHIVNVPASMLVGGSSRIVLQTAQALIKGSNSSNRVRVMFDSGSHKSFVTADVARAYNLKLLRKEWLSISTFGRKTTESGLRDVVLIDLIPVSGGGSLTLEAYVVPEISRISNEHVEVVKKDFSHLHNLWFSDVCRTKEELEIDLLIGSDYIWKFQRGRTIRGEPEEPVAIETELG